MNTTDPDSALYPLIDRAIQYYEFNSSMRQYHDIEHARNVIRDARILTDGAPSIGLMLAAMWHDAVYFPGVANNANELASAAALGNEAHLLNQTTELSEYHMLEVRRAIEMIERTTVQHHLSSDLVTGDMAVLLDSDLGALACDWPEFLDNQRGIIIENRGRVQDDESWIQCAKFLRRLMNSREYIYHTAMAREKYEALAHKNIQDLCDNCGIQHKE